VFEAAMGNVNGSDKVMFETRTNKENMKIKEILT